MTTPTIAELSPPPCCCQTIVTNCNDCQAEVVSKCFRVRHEDWDAAIPSLWGVSWPRAVPGLPTGRQFNVRCGTVQIVDQYGCSAEHWGQWPWNYYTPTEDRVFDPPYPEICPTAVNPSGLPWSPIPAAGAPLWLAWGVNGTCELVRLGVWTANGLDGFGAPGDETSFDPDDPFNESTVVADSDPPNYEMFSSPFWHENEFQIGPWIFTPADCIEPTAGPTCLRITATGVDAYCDIPQGLEEDASCDYDRNTNCRDGINNSFYGGLRNALDTAGVRWHINADKTEITLTVGTDSATFAYAANWWTTGRLVGSYTVGPCVTDCDWETSCWPDLCPCLVDGSEDPPVLYRTIYADVSGDHTETELPLVPDDALGRYQWTRGGSDAITILCMNSGLDPYMVSVSLGPDSYFCTIPANGLQCDGGQLVDEIITCGDLTIRLYTL